MSIMHIDPLGPATVLGKVTMKVGDFFTKHDRAIMFYSGASIMTSSASMVMFDAMGLPSYLVFFVQVAFNISWVAAKFSNTFTGRR